MSDDARTAAGTGPAPALPDLQVVEEIPLAALLERAQRMKNEGWRLVQACCTRLVADQEVNYSFDLDGRLLTVRVRVPMNEPEIPSLSPFFASAFLYENEMHDLFGITVRGMSVDYKGHFFTTMVPTPYVNREPDHGE
jgi:ech hydrogenase subunit D